MTMADADDLPVPGPGSGGVTPALVNLVCTGARLNYAAYAATILDLAGRGYFTASEPQPGQLTLQRRPEDAQPAGELASYERLALERTATLAGRAGVPFEVLAGAAGADTPGVWDPFAAEVRSTGRAVGLTRRGLRASAPGLVMTGAEVVLCIIAFVVIHRRHQDTASDVFGAVALVVFVGLALAFRRADRLTGAGKALAASYAGGGAGPGLAPLVLVGGPAITGDLRGSAYAVAAGRRVPIRGATPGEASGLRGRPVRLASLVRPGALVSDTSGARSQRPRQAWSSATGQWRLVPIGDDPRRPSFADVTWAFWAILVGFIAVSVGRIGLSTGIGALLTVALLALCAVLALQAVKALRRWPAYWAKKEVTGQVIARWEQHYVSDGGDITCYYLAVDDGRRAWPLRDLAGDDGVIRPGDQVRIQVARSTSTLLSHTPAADG